MCLRLPMSITDRGCGPPACVPRYGLGVTSRWRRGLSADGWLADLIWWVQSPLDLFSTKPGAGTRERRRVYVGKDGNVRDEPLTRPDSSGPTEANGPLVDIVNVDQCSL